MNLLELIYWKDGDLWLGKLREHPQVMSQGKTLEELEENVRDAYRLLVLEGVPETYQTKAIAVGIAGSSTVHPRPHSPLRPPSPLPRLEPKDATETRELADLVATMQARFPLSFGAISAEDAEEMRRVIEEQCGRVDDRG